MQHQIHTVQILRKLRMTDAGVFVTKLSVHLLWCTFDETTENLLKKHELSYCTKQGLTCKGSSGCNKPALNTQHFMFTILSSGYVILSGASKASEVEGSVKLTKML